MTTPPIKTCDYCKQTGTIPTFRDGETVCTDCMSKSADMTRGKYLALLAELERSQDEIYNLKDDLAEINKKKVVYEFSAHGLRQERDQLKAQSNQLRTALKAMNSHLNYIPALDLTVDEVLDMSPNQSLAIHDVEVIRAAMDTARDACNGHGTDRAMEYDAALCRHIDQLLEEAKESQDEA